MIKEIKSYRINRPLSDADAKYLIDLAKEGTYEVRAYLTDYFVYIINDYTTLEPDQFAEAINEVVIPV